MIWGIAVVVLVLLFAYAFPGSLPGRFLQTILSMIGLGAKNFKERNALANYNAALERQSGTVNKGVHSVADYDAMIRAAEREHAHVGGQVEICNGRLDRLDADGVPDTDAVKIKIAQDLIEYQERLQTIEGNLSRYRQNKADILGKLRDAQQQVVVGATRAKQLAADLHASEVERDLVSSTSKMDLGSGQDSLAQAEAVIQERIDRNRGNAEAMSAVFGPDSKIKQLDQKIADQKTAEFLAKRRKPTTTV